MPLDKNHLLTLKHNEDLTNKKQKEDTSPILFDVEENRFNATNNELYDESPGLTNLTSTGTGNDIMGKLIDKVLNPDFTPTVFDNIKIGNKLMQEGFLDKYGM